MYMFDLNRPPILWAILVPIQIKPEYSNISYQQAIYQRYNRRGCESPSVYGPLGEASGKESKMSNK